MNIVKRGMAPWYITPILCFVDKDFTITIGKNSYVPDDWDTWSKKEQEETIKHETPHVDQWKKYGFFFPMLYLLLPVPCIFAYFRWKFERKAYLINIRDGRSIESVVQSLWSNYFFTWPKPLMRRWFEKKMGK
jgi:hypothetical protein